MRDKAAKFSSLHFSIRTLLILIPGVLNVYGSKIKNMRVNMKQQSTFAFGELISNEIKCSLSSPLYLVRQCLSCLNGRAATDELLYNIGTSARIPDSIIHLASRDLTRWLTVDLQAGALRYVW